MILSNSSACTYRDDSPEAGKIRPNRAQDVNSMRSHGGRRSFRRERNHAPGIENPVYDDDKQHGGGHPHTYAANRYEPATTNRVLAEQNVYKTGRPPLSTTIQPYADPSNVQIVTTPMEAMQTLRLVWILVVAHKKEKYVIHIYIIFYLLLAFNCLITRNV